MSKKQAKSEQREVDLPDWADDVTPSDEVMRKFYAPTGAFKPGPITVPQPPLPSPDVTAEEETIEEPSDAQAKPQTPPEPAPERPADDVNSTLADEREAPPDINPLPLPKRETIRRSLPEVATSETPASASAFKESEREVTGEVQVIAFAEFVRRWSKYLYPGQMAVMRELYDMTLARGTTDCFTRYSELAAATKMTRRNCIKVVNFLVERGFLERLEVRNDAAGKGIKLRIHPLPQP